MTTTADIRYCQRAVNTLGLQDSNARDEPVNLKVDGRDGDKTRRCVRRFQRAWNGGRTGRGDGTEWLKVDGVLGPRTVAAFRHAMKLHDGARYLSPHVLVGECRSKGNGLVRVDRKVLRAFEELRRRYGYAIEVISVYRNRLHNEKIGGAPQSKHTYGITLDGGGSCAMDLRGRGPKPLTVRLVKQVKAICGIGSAKSTADSATAIHVDTRRPPLTQWRYA